MREGQVGLLHAQCHHMGHTTKLRELKGQWFESQHPLTAVVSSGKALHTHSAVSAVSEQVNVVVAQLRFSLLKDSSGYSDSLPPQSMESIKSASHLYKRDP